MGHLAICFLFLIPLCSFFPVYLLINWIFLFHFTFFIGLLATALWLVTWMVVLGLIMFILSQPVFKWYWFISHSSVVKNSAAVQKTWVQSLGWEDPLEEGMASHSQYCRLENPMDRGAWWATVHGVAKSWTWLKQLSMPALCFRSLLTFLLLLVLLLHELWNLYYIVLFTNQLYFYWSILGYQSVTFYGALNNLKILKTY